MIYRMQNNTITKHLKQNKMKYSKQLSIFQRKRSWGKFMKVSLELRLYFWNNNFENYCKNTNK